jgi:hypothetical protein
VRSPSVYDAETSMLVDRAMHPTYKKLRQIVVEELLGLDNTYDSERQHVTDMLGILAIVEKALNRNG